MKVSVEGLRSTLVGLATPPPGKGTEYRRHQCDGAAQGFHTSKHRKARNSVRTNDWQVT